MNIQPGQLYHGSSGYYLISALEPDDGRSILLLYAGTSCSHVSWTKSIEEWLTLSQANLVLDLPKMVAEYEI